MKSRNFNLVVLVVLLVMTAVILSSQNRKNTPENSTETGKQLLQKSHHKPPSVASSGNETTIVGQNKMPIVASGPFREADDFNPTHYGVFVGDERPPNYYLKENQLFQARPETEIEIANKKAGHFSGLAYDRKRDRLVVSSFGAEGYLDFYDLKKKEWVDSVSLQERDVEGITYWNDQICGIEMVPDGEAIKSLLFFDSNGKFLRSLELSFPVIAPHPRLMELAGELSVYSGAHELYYQIDPDSGEVTGNFRLGYQGTPAALVAVYEASDDHDTLGTLEVAVDSQAPSILVLSAYEGVHWKIIGGEHLRRVLVSGYDKPEISGLPESCEVFVMSYETSGEHLPFAHEIQSQEMWLLLSKLEEQGIGVKSIAAGYQATTAIVR